MRRLALLVAAMTACRTAPHAPTSMPAPAAAPSISAEDVTVVVRQNILESYRTLGGGYDEAYVDGIARDPRVVLIDVLNDHVAIGAGADVAKMRRIFDLPGAQLEIVSKALEVHLSADGTVAWSFDALGYRVRRQPTERTATLPLRATAAYEQRDGRWVKVLEHVSYPAHDDADVAADDPAPAELPDDVAPGGDEVAGVVRGVIACDPKFQEFVDTGEGALTVGETSGAELRGDALAKRWCPGLLFEKPAAAAPAGLRVQLARSGTAAWAAANLRIDEAGATFAVRATFVLAKGFDGRWRVEQTHLSAPIAVEKLTERVYGEAPAAP